MEDSNNYVWSFFLKEKTDLDGVMLDFIKNLKNKYNMQAQYLYHDNADENVVFEEAYKQKGLGLEFKCTAPGTPQQNGHIERKFANLFNQVHAMLNCDKFNDFLCNGLWAKAANIVTLLKNNLLILSRTLSLFQQFLGREREASYL